MSRRKPSEPATTDQITKELIAAWPGWEAEAGQEAQAMQDAEIGDATMYHAVERFLALAVCRVTGHAGPLWSPVTGIVGDMHCSRCGEDLG